MSKYDVSYWKDRFEHSQWQMPMSQRIIGDDGLYSYVGLGLVNGQSPAMYNPETPPVGKYLIGASILIFNNSVFYSIAVGIILLIVYFLFAKQILKDKFFSILAVFILIADPLFFSQFWKPWLDSLQLLFLLSSLLIIILAKGKYKILFIFLSGLFLGLFFQTKFPILFPVIFIFETYYFISKKILKQYPIFLVGLVLGIILPYFNFFILGNSLIEFIKLEKYIFSFYAKSQLSVHLGSFLESIFLGNFPLIVGNGSIRVYEWTFLWPISVIISLYTVIKVYKKEFLIKLIGLLIFLFTLIFSLIPSFPRYFLMIFPFSSLLMIFFVKNYIRGKFQKIIVLIIILYSLFNAYIYLLPKPQEVLNDFYYNYSHQYFQDIYQQDVINVGGNFSREKFFNLAKKVMQDAQIESIEVKELNKEVSPFINFGKVNVLITYKTRNLGNFVQTKTLKLLKVNSEWKIIWNWDLLLNNYNPNLKIKTTIYNGKRGSIFKDNKLLAIDKNSYLFSVNPSELNSDKEQQLLSLLSSISAIAKVRLQNTYNENVIFNTPIDLFSSPIELSDNLLKEIKNFKGVYISEYPSRIYLDIDILSPISIENTNYYECCTRIYSSFNYHGTSSLEKKYDNVLSGSDGGIIELIDKNGYIIKTVLKKQVKNGKDIYL